MRECVTTDNWVEEQTKDTALRRLKELLQNGQCLEPVDMRRETTKVQGLCRDWDALFITDEGIICRRVLPRTLNKEERYIHQKLVPNSMRNNLVAVVHKDMCRHLGYERVFAMIYKGYYWFGMPSDVADWLRAYLLCQEAKAGKGKGTVPLKQEWVGAPGVRAAVDLAVLPITTEGYRYLLVFQDYYSKWIELIPLKDKTPVSVVEGLVKEVFTRNGVVDELHSDQGLEFDCALMKEVCVLWNIMKTRMSRWRPESNRMMERCNKTIKGILRQRVLQRKVTG